VLLGYPENTAGRYMTPEYAWIYPDMTAAAALDKIRQTGRGKETLNWVYIIDSGGKLVEDLRLSNLVLADATTNVLKIDDPELVSVHATDDRDAVLKAFKQYDRTVLPVTDNNGYMLGIITVDDVLDIADAPCPVVGGYGKCFGDACIQSAGHRTHAKQLQEFAPIGILHGGSLTGKQAG